MKTIFRALHWLVFKLRIYVAWSWIYNQLYNRKYQRAWRRYLDWSSRTPSGDDRVLANLSLKEIEKALSHVEWKEDSWRAFWDAISWPERMLFWISCEMFPPDADPDVKDPRKDIWYESNQRQPENGLDCDDFTTAAIWMVRNGLSPRHKAWFLNVARIEGWSFWGHNVALVRTGTGFYNLGNWGLQGPFETVAEAIESVASDLPLVGWAVLKPSGVTSHSSLPMKLKLVRRDSRLPDEAFLLEDKIAGKLASELLTDMLSQESYTRQIFTTRPTKENTDE